MAVDYSVGVLRDLAAEFSRLNLHRPPRVSRYEAGRELTYELVGVEDQSRARARFTVEKFVGGGFAGQVYRVRLESLESGGTVISGLQVHSSYALKILIPPSGFSRLFRDGLYWLGFQGAFQLQCNPKAARAGALWQKFFRRGARLKFGRDDAVNNIHATLVDTTLGSCGELSDWVDGRTWLLEVDERLDLLKRWERGRQVDSKALGSAEYRAKHSFMRGFVELLHAMGGVEFARQYEWSTWKSQPNCLKKLDTDAVPDQGLVAVDFRAGLTLLPFLPMSPGDFGLIARGLARGSLVQFDRGDLARLKTYIGERRADFSDMGAMLEELEACERNYRDSIIDITHNHIRLVTDAGLWRTIYDSCVGGWKVKNQIDEQGEVLLRGQRLLVSILAVIGIIPFIGKAARKFCAHAAWRRHYLAMLGSWGYFCRSLMGKALESIGEWHRHGRVDEDGARRLAASTIRFLCFSPLSILPVGLQLMLTDWQHARERLAYYLIRPLRLYFNAGLREQWLLEMVESGRKDRMVSKEDADLISSQVKEPYIQKYLQSLAVHLCTLPVTQIVSVAVALIFVAMHPEMPRTQAWAIGLGIIAIFQVVPISPGSLVRGLYVVYLVVKERNFRDYNIAVFLGFFKYVGYLAFPIQMAQRYPALARFMAGRWATDAVHIVPVFGEKGALLEHKVFCLFYNWPLTIRGRIRRRSARRATKPARVWHILPIAFFGAIVFALADYTVLARHGSLPGLVDIWWLAVLVPLTTGVFVTLAAGGATLRRRFISAAFAGLLLGAFYTAASAMLAGAAPGVADIAVNGLWRLFVFTIFSTLGAMATEVLISEDR